MIRFPRTVASAPMAAKEAVLAVDLMPLSAGLKYEYKVFSALFATEDQKEAKKAFQERRKAEFKRKCGCVDQLATLRRAA